MSIRDILVYVDQTSAAVDRLRLATNLARRHDSWLSALYVRELTPAQVDAERVAELGLASATAMRRQARGVRSAIDHAGDHLMATLHALGRDSGIQTEWRSVDGPASIVVPQHARYADLCVLSEDFTGDPAADAYTFSERVLFATGRPVVLVPTRGSFQTLGRHVAIAWNSSRAAARAVQDALPLIERAEQTTVLTINPADFIVRRAAVPAEQLVKHLRRHGARVELYEFADVPPQSIAARLQSEATRLGADILVSGAFGHPKLWEKLLGGVTESLLRRMSMPLQMSY